jgi:hypothetical protein
MFIDNNFALDYVIKLEQLKSDLANIKDKIQTQIPSQIPHLNNSRILPIKRKHYREYYDDEAKYIVEKAFEWDIKTFEYTF